MIAINVTFKPGPLALLIWRLMLCVELQVVAMCAAYHTSRTDGAHAGIKYARTRGILPLYDGYYQEIINESASWLKWAHGRMVIIKSELSSGAL